MANFLEIDGDTDTLSIYRDFKSEDYPKDSRFGRIVDEPGFLKEFGSPELEETLLALSAKSIHYHYLKEFLPLKLSSDEVQPSEGQINGCSQRDPPTSKFRQDIEAEEAETLQASQSFRMYSVAVTGNQFADNQKTLVEYYLH
jgi:hypothetical protein